MQLAFALFADSANVSVEGKLNILGVFDALQVASVPTVHPRATLVMRLKGTLDETGHHKVAMSWTSPEGSELWSSSGDLEIGAPPAGAIEMDFPLILTFDLPIPKAGTHHLRVRIDEELQGDLAVHVRMGSVPMQPPSGGLVS
ncbi:MAG TPA: hypothetical protein VJR92_08890 [Gemmatimonadaceae bacterium]|nr:hypothetical protein [Gemmatimonadaceae bacterium]